MTDGDTVRLAGERVRLHGIDAPESKQTCVAGGRRWRCGSEATRALARRKPARSGLVSATRTSRARSRLRGGGCRPPGGGAISQHARFWCVEFWMFPSIQGYFRGSRRSRYLARGSPFRHGLNPPPAATRSPTRSLTQLEAWIRYIAIDLKAALSMPRSSRIACTHFGVRPMPLQVCSGCCGSRYFAGLLRRELLASSEGLYPGLRQGRNLGRALRTNPRPIEVEGPHVGALRGIEASLREEREGLVPEAVAPFRGRARSHGATHRGRRRLALRCRPPWRGREKCRTRSRR